MIYFRSVFFIVVVFFMQTQTIAFADSPIQIKKIAPEMNKLIIEDNKIRYLVFYDGLEVNGDVLIIDGSELTSETLEYDTSQYREYKYSPIFYENYIFKNSIGWINIELRKEELHELPIEKSEKFRNKLPEKLFRSDLENLDFNYSFYDGNESYSIAKHSSRGDEIIWSYQDKITNSYNKDFYWLGQSKLLEWSNKPIFGNLNQSFSPKIIDFYLNSVDDAFEDYFIIGYGDSCIIATNESMNSIRIYSLNRELLYSLQSIDILSPTKCNFNEQGGSIKIAYYKFPFIIIQLLFPGGLCGFGETFLIINVESNISIEPNIVDQTYLMGIFGE